MKLKKKHITEKQYAADHNTKEYAADHNTKQYTTDHNTKLYTTDHNTKHIQYTVFPEMPMVAQLIKIFPNFMELSLLHSSFNVLPKYEQSNSILI